MNNPQTANDRTRWGRVRILVGIGILVVLAVPLVRDGENTWVRSLFAKEEPQWEFMKKPEYADRHHVDWSALSLEVDRIEIEVWQSVPQAHNGETTVFVLKTPEEKTLFADWLTPRGLPHLPQLYIGGPGCAIRFIKDDEVVNECWENKLYFGYEYDGQSWVMPIRHAPLSHFLERAEVGPDSA